MAVLIVFTLMLVGITLSQVVREEIVFLNEDGKSSIVYSSTRSGFSSYNVWFLRDDIKKPEDHLRDYLYVYPERYDWNTKDERYDILMFPEGSYAFLKYQKLANLEIRDDGVFVYRNWDGKTKTPEGHYGYWNSPSNYTRFAYVWVFPKNFEIVSYESNRKGKWVIRHNTLAYYGSNVNDLVFTIRYKPVTADIYAKLKQSGAKVKVADEGVKVELQSRLLFPTGSSELSDEGKKVLRRIVKSLEDRELKLIIEGHTDNKPLRGKLKEKYRSNWGLSAARALAVIEYMRSIGVPEDRLELRAYGDTKPIATNDTEEGRAKNRRIEVLILK